MLAGHETPCYTKSQVDQVVKEGRKAIQLMFHVAAYGHGSKPGGDDNSTDNTTMGSALDLSNDQFETASQTSLYTNFSDTIEAEGLDPSKLKASKKYKAYARMKGLLNIHLGIHHWEVIKEYGACQNVFTLLGEDKHR
jgi:hypothetical protein